MNPEIGDFNIYTKIENEDFDPETEYKPITDGKGKPNWPIEKIINDKRQRQPEVRKKIWS